MKNSKTGVEWPNLVRLDKDGRQKIVTPLSIKKESFRQGNPFQDLTQQFQMAQLENSIQKQDALLETICKKVDHIQKGQMNDRIALLESGIDQIAFALKRGDNDSGKRNAIESGINNMITARNAIFREYKLQVEDFESVPHSQLERIMMGFIHNNYLQEKSKEYNQIVDLYDFFKESTKYIAFAHILIGQPQMVEDVYENSLKKLKNVDYRKLKSIKNIFSHKECYFLDECDQKDLQKDKKECLNFDTEFKSLNIEFTGSQLLEVINHEEKE